MNRQMALVMGVESVEDLKNMTDGERFLLLESILFKPDTEVCCISKRIHCEDEVLSRHKSIVKKGLMKVKDNMPKVFAETTDLKADGELSVDGTKKLVALTSENIVDYDEYLSEKPEGYSVTAKYLSGLTATALKNFIKARPLLDDEIKLNLKRETILKQLLELLGLTDIDIMETEKK